MEKKIIIEIDGSKHTKDTINLENRKDTLLKKCGYKVYRIKINEKKSRNSNLNLIVDRKIKEVLKNDFS
jgi:very-short-patch-repair endonuclease